MVPDGALSNMMLSYPSPHTVRRNFTLLPFDDPTQPLFTDPAKQANSSFSASAIQAILQTSAGDYKSFQTALEAFEVRAWMWAIVVWVFSCPMLMSGTTRQRAFDYGGVRGLISA